MPGGLLSGRNGEEGALRGQQRALAADQRIPNARRERALSEEGETSGGAAHRRAWHGVRGVGSGMARAHDAHDRIL